MQTATKQKIDSLMLQLQDVLEDEYSENDAIQTAFNDLAIVLDDVVNNNKDPTGSRAFG